VGRAGRASRDLLLEEGKEKEGAREGGRGQEGWGGQGGHPETCC
jgi:hypothetical protein